MDSEKVKEILDTINESEMRKLTDEEKQNLIAMIIEDETLSDDEKFIRTGVIRFGNKELFIKDCQRFTSKYEEKHDNIKEDVKINLNIK